MDEPASAEQTPEPVGQVPHEEQVSEAAVPGDGSPSKFKVRLANFEGPFDLLLQLIDLRRHRRPALRRARRCGDGGGTDERRTSKGVTKRHHDDPLPISTAPARPAGQLRLACSAAEAAQNG